MHWWNKAQKNIHKWVKITKDTVILTPAPLPKIRGLQPSVYARSPILVKLT